MFSGFMINAWTEATIVAVVAGVVGFFTVLRGSAFVAHAVPNGAFAGAAGASLLAINTILGLGVFSLLGALAIGVLGRRGRHDVVTALALVFMLGLGALFLSMSVEYAPEIYSLLFGEVLGVSSTELVPTAALAVVCIAAVTLLYRPLMLSSVLPEAGEARGVSRFRMELCFLIVVALATTMTVPVVGTFLIFSLMIGAPAAARSFTDRPAQAIVLSVAIALGTVWLAIALSYTTNYPVGFFVGTLSAVAYAVGRAWGAWQRRRAARPGARASSRGPGTAEPAPARGPATARASSGGPGTAEPAPARGPATARGSSGGPGTAEPAPARGPATARASGRGPGTTEPAPARGPATARASSGHPGSTEPAPARGPATAPASSPGPAPTESAPASSPTTAASADRQAT